ncbi:hypothetical protein [Natronococcus occultus]|uniref:Uncharacterized protein n=1 Tax=Natronococcus occultus SP4 TaxID=694430 RepID=L0JYD9_9EURY|nr:hypothetical protein [Natronococcus occultus]AGB38072.1 hypothetical protein Natoc_2294 [Natronococcus occultus SP4]
MVDTDEIKKMPVKALLGFYAFIEGFAQLLFQESVITNIYSASDPAGTLAAVIIAGAGALVMYYAVQRIGR